MAKTYLKDKKDFTEKYFSPGWNFLREVVAHRDSIVLDKVEVKIMIPCYEKQAKEALKQIKD